jgi:hypothetical protein
VRGPHPASDRAFRGSIPLPDSEIVFRTLSSAVGQHLKRVPDGETGIRKTWIRFLQEVLAQNPAIEKSSRIQPSLLNALRSSLGSPNPSNLIRRSAGQPPHRGFGHTALSTRVLSP